MKSIRFFCLSFILLLTSCQEADDSAKKGLIPIENITVKIEQQKINFIQPASGLRFDNSAYGDYTITNILITVGDEPPFCLKLPIHTGGGTVKIFKDNSKNNQVIIDFDHEVAIQILNQPWNKIILIGSLNYSDNFCSIHLLVKK